MKLSKSGRLLVPSSDGLFLAHIPVAADGAVQELNTRNTISNEGSWFT